MSDSGVGVTVRNLTERDILGIIRLQQESFPYMAKDYLIGSAMAGASSVAIC